MATSFLQVDNLTKSYGDRILFSDVTFGVYEGDKIGVIAKNGTGKSTLLNIIAGKESPDSGNIVFRNGLRTGILDQNPDFGSAGIIMEYMMEGHTATTEHDANYADRAVRQLSQLGITDSQALISTLSGGQRKRVALAKVILGNP